MQQYAEDERKVAAQEPRDPRPWPNAYVELEAYENRDALRADDWTEHAGPWPRQAPETKQTPKLATGPKSPDHPPPGYDAPGELELWRTELQALPDLLEFCLGSQVIRTRSETP